MLDLKGVYDKSTQQVTVTSASGKEFTIKVVEDSENSFDESSSEDDIGTAMGTVELRRQSKLTIDKDQIA